MTRDAWNESLDRWLSTEAGQGPPEDDAWRRGSGFLHPFGAPPAGGEGSPDAPGAPEAAAAPGALDPGAYTEARRGFRDAMSAFLQRLMYAFPQVQDLDAEQITLAAGWITDMEARTLITRVRAEVYARRGAPELLAEVDAALRELAQLKEAYAVQRHRLQREQGARIAAINQQAEAHARRQQEERRRIWQETNDYIAGLRKETEQRRRESADRQHREFLRYIRGERVIGTIEVVEK